MKEEEPAFETLRFFSQNETMKNVQHMRLFNLLATVSITKNNTFVICKVVKGRVTKIQNEKHALERTDRQMSREVRGTPFNSRYCVWQIALKLIFYKNV
jgi:hypothetical protein